MSGFSNDVMAILRTSVLLHGEALGYVMFARKFDKTQELLKKLESLRLPVTGKASKPVVQYDYTIVPSEMVCVPTLLLALTTAKKGGIIILEVTDNPGPFTLFELDNTFADFKITKVKYEDRIYVVFHSGVDYGN